MMKFVPVKLGCVGEKVKLICKQLAAAGSTIKPTNVFHIGMLSAVSAFQKKKGLPVTGIVDKKTFDKLMAVKPKRARKK